MSKFLPALLFAICIAIALILAWSVQPLWPAALAIAIAGAALAMAMNAQAGGGDEAYLIDEVAALRESDAALRAELASARSMIDDLADVVEQIATFTADGGASASRGEIDSLKADLGALQANARPDADLLDRLAAMETRLASMAAEPAVSTPSAVAAQVAPEPNGDSGKLRTLIARAKGQPGAPPESAAQSAPDPMPEPPAHPSQTPARVSLTPIFKPTLGAPVAFVVESDAPDSLDAVPAIFRHAGQIANELESANRDVRLFVRLSGSALAHLTVRRDILAHVDNNLALCKRLTLMTPQQGYDETVQNTLAAVAERGCKFALDDVRDWSINLASLSRAGLGWIVVDGIAMARSAEEQGGDPRRLAQALAAHGIDLIAGDVMIREDIATVRALEPVMVMGDGLGIPRKLDEPA